MTEWLLKLIGSAILGPLLTAFGALVCVFVMTRNYLRIREERLHPDWVEGEHLLARVRVGSTLSEVETVLSTHRVIQLRLSWFLSRRRLTALDLKDATSVGWSRRTNWPALVAAWFTVSVLNPVALLLLMAGLQGRIYTVRFNAPFSRMPLGRISVRSFWRRHLPELSRLHATAQKAWTEVRARQGLPSVPPPQLPGEPEGDFLWSSAVWFYLVLILAVAVGQRFVFGHSTLDDYVAAPLLLSLPIVAARRSLEDGLWTALFEVVGIVTVKFPSGVLFHDGTPQYLQYAAVVVTLLVMVAVARVVAVKVHPALAAIAILLWLGLVGVLTPDAASDLGLFARLALAVAAVPLVASAEALVLQFLSVQPLRKA